MSGQEVTSWGMRVVDVYKRQVLTTYYLNILPGPIKCMCLAVIDGIYVFFILFNISVAIYSHQTSYNKVLWNSDYTAITGYEVNQGNRYPRLYRGTNNSGGRCV